MCMCAAFATRQARDNLGALGQEELQQFQDIIDMENPDLYKWLTGQTPVPEEVCAAAGSLDLFGRCAKVFIAISPSRLLAGGQPAARALMCGLEGGDGAKGDGKERRRLRGQGVGVS